MNSLRPNSVCDTTPLKRLESQSSCSEPSSPTTNGGLCVGVSTTATIVPTVASATIANGGCLMGVNGLGATGNGSDTTTSSSITTTSTTLSLNNHHINNYNNNNNKNEKSLNIFGNSSLGGRGGGGAGVIVIGTGDKHKMELYGTRKICCRLLVDLIILACVGLPILSFNLWGESYKRGFFCNDDSLMHPYHESTVASWMLYLMCFLIPIGMITIVEFFKSNSHKMHTFGNLSGSNYYFLHLEIPDWMVECYKRIGLLIFGSGVCELTTDIAKYSIGRLRPHFFAVCQPILPDGSTCDNPLNEGRYIEDFTCRGLDYTTKILKEAHLSFPSGHASFTSFTMIYIAIYLHKRMTCSRSKMFKHLLQFMFLMFAWYTSLTRVSDYKHHWTDVLAGSLIGTLYAIIVIPAVKFNTLNVTDMFPLTATYYDSKQKLWSGPERKDLYNESMTLGEVAFLEFSKNPQKIIQINDSTNEKLTAAQFLDHVTALGKNMLKLGLKAGDVVGLYSHNFTHTATVMVASYLCGTPVNALYPGFDKASVQLIYKVTTPKVIFCDVENYEITFKVCKELNLNVPIYIMNGEIEGVPSILSLVKSESGIRNEPFAFPCVNLNGDDTAVILCSSGTTGTPKGVRCSHRALLNQSIYLSAKSDSVMCTFSTMYWASGLWNLNASLTNCCLRIVTDKSYTPEYFLQLVERHKITHMITNASQMAELSMYENVPKMQKYLASIDTFVVGGSKVPLIVQEKMINILKVNDKRIGFGVAYGMSELSGMLSYNGGYLCERKVGSEGKLTPNKKVRIINKNGEFLGANKHGEIIISTPYTWFGYYRNVEATQKASVNNWLHTGDIGFFDDEGFLHVCARDNDVFKARNFQIYPQLIEDVVMQIPGVYEACVFGIPDLVATHLIGCAVIRKGDFTSKLTAKEIISYVESKMGSMYHLSGGVYFVDAIPKTGSGKVQRAKVLDLVQQMNKK